MEFRNKLTGLLCIEYFAWYFCLLQSSWRNHRLTGHEGVLKVVGGRYNSANGHIGAVIDRAGETRG